MKVVMFFIFILSFIWLCLVWHSASHPTKPSRIATDRDASQNEDDDTADEPAPPRRSKARPHTVERAIETAPALPTPVPASDDAPRYIYIGKIIQHIGNDGLLVHCNWTQLRPNSARGDVALFAYPLANQLPDGDTIQFQACKAGLYKYTTVQGALSTITKVVYAQPTPKPNSGFHSVLDERPVKRTRLP